MSFNHSRAATGSARSGVDGRVAVIVCTYNRPDALAAVLRGLAAQTDPDFEILVADDGSGPETAAVIAAWRPRLRQELKHVWHRRNGFRLAAIRNRAIAATTCRYIIFLDGDCVPPHHFVAGHRRLAEPGWFVSGGRILLRERATHAVLVRGARIEDWSLLRWLAERLRGGIERLLPALPLPATGAWRRRSFRRVIGARGCNIAFWRENLLRVDGFDECFEGWGHEDTDLVIRLMRAGVFHKSGRFAVCVFHLWHDPNPRAPAGNQHRLSELQASGRVQALRGLGAAAREEAAASHAGAAGDEAAAPDPPVRPT